MNKELCDEIADMARKKKKPDKARKRAKKTANKKGKKVVKKEKSAADKRKNERLREEEKEAVAAAPQKESDRKNAKAAKIKKDLVAAAAAAAAQKESARKATAAKSNRGLMAALKQSRREIKTGLEKKEKEAAAAAADLKESARRKATAAKSKRELMAALKQSRLEKKKKKSSGGRKAVFFAQTDVPVGWSTEQAVRETTYPYKVKSRDANYEEKILYFTKPVGGLRKDEVESLLPGKWYFDNVIWVYMTLLQSSRNKLPKSVLLPTEFYLDLTRNMPGRRSFSERHRTEAAHWTVDINTTHRDAKIFIPLNVNRNHWVLVVVDNGQKKVFSLDSSGSAMKQHRNTIMKWVEHEHIAKKADFDKSTWTSEAVKVPLQENASDCGPFVCLFAAFWSHGKAINFTQADLPKLRERVNWSILNSKLEIDK